MGIYFFTYLRLTKAAYPAVCPTLCIPISYSSKPYLLYKINTDGGLVQQLLSALYILQF